MKILFKITPENVSSYSRSTKGFEFINTIEADEEAYQIVQSYEDTDFFPQEDGTVLRESGSDCYDPKYPGEFDFGDYRYMVWETSDINDYDDIHIIKAIQEYSPWNLDEILSEIENG